MSNDRDHKFGPLEINVGSDLASIDGCTKCDIAFCTLFEILEFEFNLDTGKMLFRCEGLDELSKDQLINIINELYPCKLTNEEGGIKDIIE